MLAFNLLDAFFLCHIPKWLTYLNQTRTIS